MRALSTASLTSVLVLGAHCDDIAIGAGASLLELCRASPGVTVTALVLTGGGTEREAEERNALAAFCPDASLEVTVLDLPDGHLPAHWREVKTAIAELRARCTPELIMAPQRHDANQDHRLVAEVVWQEFRNHLVLGYEILKYESDLPAVTAYIAVGEETARAKTALLHEHYPSQHHRTWFDDEAFLGLLRVRGAQCQEHWAEGFVAEKIVLTTRS